jgi:hypothetical protein
MRLTIAVSAVAAAAALCAAMPGASAARFYDPAVQAGTPSLVEDVACRTVRSRIVRPGGRVVYSTKRVCSPGMGGGGGGCRVVRERIQRPNGSVVYRSTRRCS